MTTMERFNAKWLATPSGCWEWQAARRQNGYGSFQLEGDNQLAHRVAYELFVGPIPGGLTIDHLCSNKRCVNPEHLEAVTIQENQRRAYADITHCPKGHEYTAENMLVRRGKARRDCRECNRVAARERARRKAVTCE